MRLKVDISVIFGIFWYWRRQAFVKQQRVLPHLKSCSSWVALRVPGGFKIIWTFRLKTAHFFISIVMTLALLRSHFGYALLCSCPQRQHSTAVTLWQWYRTFHSRQTESVARNRMLPPKKHGQILRADFGQVRFFLLLFFVEAVPVFIFGTRAPQSSCNIRQCTARTVASSVRVIITND